MLHRFSHQYSFGTVSAWLHDLWVRLCVLQFSSFASIFCTFGYCCKFLQNLTFVPLGQLIVEQPLIPLHVFVFRVLYLYFRAIFPKAASAATPSPSLIFLGCVIDVSELHLPYLSFEFFLTFVTSYYVYVGYISFGFVHLGIYSFVFRNPLMPYYIYPFVEEQKFDAELHFVAVYLSYLFGFGVDDFVMVELVRLCSPRSMFT